MSETSSKKRLAITITSLCIAVVAVVASVIAIFAAAAQTVDSQFQVQYVANNVSAKVSASYQMNKVTRTDGTASAWEAVGEEVALGNTAFTADEETQAKSIERVDDILFTSTNSAIVFKYTFENTSSSTAFTVTLTDNAINNPGWTYTPEDESEPVTLGKTENVSAAYAWEVKDDEAELSYGASLNPTITGSEWTITVEAGQTVEVYIRVTIVNVSNTARYMSNGGGLVKFDLASVA